MSCTRQRSLSSLRLHGPIMGKADGETMFCPEFYVDFSCLGFDGPWYTVRLESNRVARVPGTPLSVGSRLGTNRLRICPALRSSGCKEDPVVLEGSWFGWPVLRLCPVNRYSEVLTGCRGRTVRTDCLPECVWGHALGTRIQDGSQDRPLFLDKAPVGRRARAA